MTARNVARTIGKWLLRIFLFIIALLLLVWLLLQISAIQTWVVGKVTDSLEQTLGTEVAVERVDLKFFKTAALSGIYVEDQAGDTLLYARELDVDIGVFNLFGSEIFLNDIALDGAVVNLYRRADSTNFNYQFLVDAFAPDTTATTSAAWDFGLGSVRVTDARIRNRDEVTGADQFARIGTFGVDIGSLDLESQAVDVDQILLRNSFVRAEVFAGTEVPDTLVVNEATGELEYPYTGWDITLDELRLSDNQIEYEDLQRTESVQGLDANNLAISDLDLVVRDFSWTEEALALQLDSFNFAEQSGLHLDRFAFALNATPERIDLTDLRVLTGDSQIALTSEVTFDAWNDLATQGDALAANLNFSETRIAFADLRALQQFGVEIPNVNLALNEFIYLDGTARYRANEVSATDLTINVGNDFRIRLDAVVRDLTSDNPYFDVQLRQVGLSYADLRRFTTGLEIPPALEGLGNLRLTARAEGRLDDFLIENIDLQTDAYTGFRGRGRVWNATDPNRLRYDFAIEELTTEYADIAGFLPPEGVPQLEALGQIRYAGTLKGTLTEVDVDGELNSEAGTVIANADVQFNADYSDATYEGRIELQQFDLERVLQDTTLGVVSLTLEGRGSGLDPTRLDAETALNIGEFSYLGYTYHDIRLDGRFSEQRFAGQFKLDDENAQLDFDGTVNLNAANPEFDFTLLIDTLNLDELNLYPNDLSLSAKLVADFTANNIDDLNGRAVLSDFHVRQDDYRWYADSLVVDADQVNATEKALTIDSDFLKFAMRGEYTLSRLPDAFAALTNEFIEVENFLFEVQQTDSLSVVTTVDPAVLNDQNFTVELEICEPDPWRLFVPALEDFHCLQLEGELDGAQRDLALKAVADKLVVAGLNIDAVELNMDGDRAGIVTKVAVRDLEVSEAMAFSDIVLNSRLVDDSLNWALTVSTDSVEQQLALGAAITNVGTSFRMQMREKMSLNGETWRFPGNHEILFGNDQLDFENVRFQRRLQEIRVQTNEPQPGETTDPVAIFFSNFKLSEVSQLAQLDQDYVEGRLNGKVVLNDLQGSPYYLADIQTDSLTLNGEPVGTLSIDAGQQANSSNITIAASLSGTANQLTVDGNYDVAAQNFNVGADIQKLEMRLVDLATLGNLRESEGYLSGEVTVKGSPDAPDIGGFIATNDLSTVITFLGVRIGFSDERISLSNDRLQLGKFTLYDEDGSEAELNGAILHDNFTDMRFDISLNAQDFLLMNTTPEDNPLFYGKVNANARVNVTGPSTLPEIDIFATTLDSTVFTLSPLAATDDGAPPADAYIIFANPDEFAADSSLNQQYQATTSVPMRLRMVVDVTPAALFRMIADPALGEGLAARGTANLELQLEPNGAINMYGVYEVQEGSYDVQFGPVGRRFDLLDGSVNFSGDPLDATMNVEAAYDVRTSLQPLIAAQTNDDGGNDFTSRELVRVLLYLRGGILSPDITFDLNFPDRGGEGSLGGQVGQKLASMRANPDEMNRQVFALLIQGSFIPEQGTAAPQNGNLVAGAALSTVSGILNDQLSKLTDNLVKGVDVSVNLDSYQNEYTGNVETSANIAVSKSLLNERLKVTYGQDFAVGAAAQNAGSQVIGDFMLTYELTEDGRYLLRAFHMNDFDPLQGENTPKNGVGIRFSRSFGQ